MADPVNPVTSADQTSLAAGGYDKVLILNKIFDLLNQMVQTLQVTAAVQSERLNFLSNWQRAYTQLMDQVPAFTQDSASFSGTDTTTQTPVRDDANRINSTYTEQLRSQNTIINDDAQALQSSIDQVNSAVTDQTNLATTIIQQFSTILSSLYR